MIPNPAFDKIFPLRYPLLRQLLLDKHCIVYILFFDGKMHWALSQRMTSLMTSLLAFCRTPDRCYCKLMSKVNQIDNDEESEISNYYWIDNGVVRSDVEFATKGTMTLWGQIIHRIYLFYKRTFYSMEYAICIHTFHSLSMMLSLILAT